MKKSLSGLTSFLLLCAIGFPAAAEVVPSTVAERPLVLGAGVVYRDKTYRGYDDDEKWQPLPLVLWEGERFFFRGANGGWKAFANENWELAVLAEFRGDGYDSDDADILEGMDDRDPSIDGGAQVTWRNGAWGLRGTWVTDLTSEHEGWRPRPAALYAHKRERQLGH